MKYGIIYGDWLVAYEIENENTNSFRKNGEMSLFKNWSKVFDSKMISKKCYISNRAHFLKILKKFENSSGDLEQAFWEKESSKINYYEEIFQLTYHPKVSVILASYNSTHTIENAIRSIIKQNYNNIELIVIDDGSLDDSLEKIIRMKERYSNRISNFQVIKNESNKGVYYSRNTGIKASTGDIIAIQDADDISDGNRLLKSVWTLIDSDVEFILSNGIKFNEIGNISRIKVAMATLIVRKDFYQKYGYYDEETRHSGDLEILDRAYFMKYGNYELDNFWYWLNYTDYKENFYKHIYDNLYYIKDEDTGITKNNGILKRLEYLNARRKMMKNKI